MLSRFRRLRLGDAAISVVTWGELLYGAERSRQRERALEALREFVSQVPVLPSLSWHRGSTYPHMHRDT